MNTAEDTKGTEEPPFTPEEMAEIERRLDAERVYASPEVIRAIFGHAFD
ncbi:hypothetical protein [Novosphingobium sp. 17-62-19]|nr:hypothetical protein [Novosphingobium sp. 17-62-19]HQS98567.1 hypothetical protein [Novosphingobium sp.]